jgi:hypothetical protein
VALPLSFSASVSLPCHPQHAPRLCWFAAYVAADGVFAILAGTVAARRSERWQTLILEGVTNLALAGAVLVWPAVAVGHLVLTIAGAASAVWGALEATIGPSATSDPRSIGSSRGGERKPAVSDVPDQPVHAPVGIGALALPGRGNPVERRIKIDLAVRPDRHSCFAKLRDATARQSEMCG